VKIQIFYFVILTVIAKIIAIIRENTVLHKYGILEEISLYIIYAAIPISVSAFLHYIVNWQFTSAILRIRRDFSREIFDSIISLLLLFCFCSAMISIFIFIASEVFYLNFNIYGANYQLIYLCLFYIPLSFIFSVYNSIFTVISKPAYILFANIFGSIITIYLIYILHPTAINMAASVNIGMISQIFLSIILTFRRFQFRLITYDILSTSGLYKGMEKNIIYQSVVEMSGQMSPVVDKFSVARLDVPGGLGALHYASNIVGLITSVFVTFIMYIVQNIDRGKLFFDKILNNKSWLTICTCILFITMAAAITFSGTFVQIMFGVSSANDSQIQEIAFVLRILIIGGLLDILYAFIFSLRIKNKLTIYDLVPSAIYMITRILFASTGVILLNINIIFLGIAISSLLRTLMIFLVYFRLSFERHETRRVLDN
jgi:hypothetical protein